MRGWRAIPSRKPWGARRANPSPPEPYPDVRRHAEHVPVVASLLAYDGVPGMAVDAASKAYVLRLAEALHREFARDGVTVTTQCPGVFDTGFAQAAGQKITWALRPLMMQPPPVVRTGIRALDADRTSVVPGISNMLGTAFAWATPRWPHQPMFARAVGR